MEHSVPEVVLICLAFALTHSYMVSRKGKMFFASLLGEQFLKCYYRLFFVIFSATTMMVAFFLILSLPDFVIFKAPVWLKWPMHFIQLSGMVFGMFSLRVLDAQQFFGFRQLKRCRGKVKDSGELTIDGEKPLQLATTGVYSIVRHPIYLAGIIMITFQPTITYNRLAVTILADLYFLYATFKEETILKKKLGEQYIKYMQKVPRFNIFLGLYRKYVAEKT